MQFTSPWWGSAPVFTRNVLQAQSQHPGKIEAVSLYMPDAEMSFPEVSALFQQYGITENSNSVGIIDGRRFLEWEYDGSSQASLIGGYLSETEQNYPVSSAIGFQSSFSGRTLDLDLNLYVKEAGDYKVTVLVLENGIIDYQADWYADESTDYNRYQHNNVARRALTNVTGEAFATAENNKLVKRHYSTTLPSEYNLDNLRVLVVVQRAFGSQPRIVDAGSNYGDYYVDNCVSGKAGTRVLPTVANESDGGNEGFTGGNPINW